MTRNITVPVSAGLLADIDGYIAALTAYRDGDTRPIITAFNSASMRGIQNGRVMAGDVEEIRASYAARMSGVRSDSVAHRIAQILFRQPVVNLEIVRSATGAAPVNIYRALNIMTERGVIHEATSKRRNRIWVADDIVRALDDFSKRAGRRG